MRIYLILIINFLFVSAGFSQYRASNTLFYQNSTLINPAFTGSTIFSQVSLGYKKQLMEVDGAPTTFYATANVPFTFGKSENILTINDVTTDDFVNHSKHHGFGFNLLSDKVGPFKSLNITASYAYHIPLNQQYNLSLGVGLGINQYRYDEGRVVYPDGQTDPANIYSDEQFNKTDPDLSLGLSFYNESFFASVSATDLIQSKSSLNLSTQYFVYSGYKFNLNDHFSVIPSLMVNTDLTNSVKVNFFTKGSYNNFIWIGGGIRESNQYSLTGGIRISQLLNAGYSYDFSNSSINLKRGAHNFTINLLLNNRNNLLNLLW